MAGNEQKLSDFIDRLNADLKPDEDERTAQSEELRELYRTVRKVRSLREPVMPEEDFLDRLTNAVGKQVSSQRKRSPRRKPWGWVTAVAAVAAALVLWLNFPSLTGQTNIVNAMAEAFRKVEAYHGVLEIAVTSADGETAQQGKWDVWADKDGRYYVKGLDGAQRDLVTANDGKTKWQIQPDAKEVHLFPTVPDAYRVQFEIGREIEEAQAALSTRVVGEETVAGRSATVLEVTPDGGLPYRIWVDAETKLPLRKETAMTNALQYTFTYTHIEFADAIPESLLSYELPEGYREIAANPEQIVLDAGEAEAIAGFPPQLPESLSSGYVLDRIAVIPEQSRVKAYYVSESRSGEIVVTQGPASGEFAPDASAVIGHTGGLPVEVLASVDGDVSASSVRWRQEGMEFAVLGKLTFEELRPIAETFMSAPLELPAGDTAPAGDEPAVEVEYDLEVERADQQNADAGSAPWKLDPLFVAQVFVSLQMSPGGIEGDYPIAMDDLEMTQNDGVRAVILVHDEDAPISRVFVERVVRQDDTGIWTVVGYDPRS